MIQGLRTVVYPVDDLSTGKDWYTKVLGQKPYFDEPYYVGFNVGGFELGLIPDGKPGAGGAVAYWGVRDAAAAVKKLESLGAKVREELTEVGEGIKVAVVADPFGNSFGVIENPNFEPDKMR